MRLFNQFQAQGDANWRRKFICRRALIQALSRGISRACKPSLYHTDTQSTKHNIPNTQATGTLNFKTYIQLYSKHGFGAKFRYGREWTESVVKDLKRGNGRWLAFIEHDRFLVVLANKNDCV